jgi:NADPH:quinone reductase
LLDENKYDLDFLPQSNPGSLAHQPGIDEYVAKIIIEAAKKMFVWELMFTRLLFQTTDMISQHYLLNTVADLIDNNKIKSTLTDVLSPINAENLRKAHRKLESGTTIGKIVLSGF